MWKLRPVMRFPFPWQIKLEDRRGEMANMGKVRTKDIIAAGGWKEPALGSEFAGGRVTAIDREEQRVRIDGALWVYFDPRNGRRR